MTGACRHVHADARLVVRIHVYSHVMFTCAYGYVRLYIKRCNRKLLISRAPIKAKSQEAAYSLALNQNKIDRQRSRSRESGMQADS